MSFFSVLTGIAGGALGFGLGGPIGAAIGASIGGSIGGSIDDNQSVREANAANLSESQANREFNAEQATLAFNRQRQLQQEQNEWNSVGAQAGRLREAGFNPFVALGSGLSDSSGSTGSVSPASAPPAFNAIQPVPSVGASVIDGVVKIASAYKDIKDADLSGSQKNRIDSLLQGELVSQNLANSFDAIYKPQLATAQQKQIYQDVALKVQQALTLASEGKLADTKVISERVSAALNRAIIGKTEQETKLLKQKNDTFMTEFQAQLDYLASSSDANRASARLSNEQANEIAQLLPSKKEFQDYSTVEKATAFLEAFQEYSSHKLTPEEIKTAREKFVQQIEHDQRMGTYQQYNPAEYIAWTLYPLAQTIGIALTGSANASIKPKVPPVK